MKEFLIGNGVGILILVGIWLIFLFPQGNKTLEIIISAFSGGFFAAWWTNHFESKRRVSEKRRDKYFEHRNTIVQIEHELIPARVNLSRNIYSIEDAIKESNPENVRLLLRFYEIFLSTGMSLRLLNMEFINKYSEIYSSFDKLNSDFKYLAGMVDSIRSFLIAGNIDESLIKSYVQMILYIKDECLKVDQLSMQLLAMCKVVLTVSDDDIIKSYIANGKQVDYTISEDKLNKQINKVDEEEIRPWEKDEKREKFFAPFLDLKPPHPITFDF